MPAFDLHGSHDRSLVHLVWLGETVVKVAGCLALPAKSDAPDEALLELSLSSTAAQSETAEEVCCDRHSSPSPPRH